MNPFLKKILTAVVLFSWLLLGQCVWAQEVSSGVYREDALQYRFLEKIIGEREQPLSVEAYQAYSVAKAVILVQKDFLTDVEMVTLARRIAEGITSLETYLKITLDSIYGDNSRIYYIVGNFDVSHTFGGYRHNQVRQPIVFLNRVRGVAGAFYLHETAHIFTPDYASLWLREGLADLLNDRLGGYPSFRYQARGVDVETARRLQSPALAYVGENGIPNINRNTPDDARLRDTHYLLAYSFVKYLEERLGFGKIMAIYHEKDTVQAIQDLTGKTVDQWKTEWVSYLKTLSGAMLRTDLKAGADSGALKAN